MLQMRLKNRQASSDGRHRRESMPVIVPCRAMSDIDARHRPGIVDAGHRYVA
jgi:hypothetical protein